MDYVLHRVVLHIDMDAFFASVEVLGNPWLRGRPVIVGGEPGSRSVVCTASYEAREFGIKAGMPTAEAERRCPDGVFLGGNPSKYIYYSIQLLEILRGFSPLVEPFSIDEAFVELTDQVESLEEGREIARAIQRRLVRRLRLTASVGLGPNKLIAKMASKRQKPAGLTALDQQAFRRTFWPLPTQDLWGVGEKTSATLERMRIRTIGELAHTPRALLERVFGVVGGYLRAMSRGDDATPIIPYYEGVPVKSMGHEHTLSHDEDDPHRIESHLLRLTDQVARRLRTGGKLGRTVVLKLRFTNFRTITRQQTLPRPTATERVIFAAICDLLRKNLEGRSVRLIGVSVSSLVPAGGESGLLFPNDLRRQQMTRLVDDLRNRLGDDVLIRARVLGLRKRRGLVKPQRNSKLPGRRNHARTNFRGSFPRRGPRQL